VTLPLRVFFGSQVFASESGSCAKVNVSGDDIKSCYVQWNKLVWILTGRVRSCRMVGRYRNRGPPVSIRLPQHRRCLRLDLRKARVQRRAKDTWLGVWKPHCDCRRHLQHHCLAPGLNTPSQVQGNGAVSVDGNHSVVSLDDAAAGQTRARRAIVAREWQGLPKQEL
jgi:hypothetical protein